MRFNTGSTTLNQAKEKKAPALKLGTWNVRTMTPDVSDDLQQIDDVRKTAVETEQTADGHRRPARDQAARIWIYKGGLLFFMARKIFRRDQGIWRWLRGQKHHTRIHFPPTEGNERILSLQLHLSAGPVTLISANAPTLASFFFSEAKDKFYDDLAANIAMIPCSSSATSTPELVLITVHGPPAWVSSAQER